MKLSVVIPCRNAAATIGFQLDALRRQQWDQEWEVIVADNGSTDSTLALIEQHSEGLPGLQVVDAADRRGAGHARNVGALFARGEAIAFCDADDEVGEGWLAAVGAAIETHEIVASRFDIRKLNPLSVVGRLRNPQSEGLQRIKYPPYLHHAGGSGLTVTRRLHDKIGGFDESLRQLEDTDYCFRAQRLGCELYFAADAVVHVRYSSKPLGLFRQSRLWAEHNELMYKRYGDGCRMNDPWLVYGRTWRDLLLNLPRLLHQESRAAWLKTLGTQIGLLEGALRYRVPPVR